MELDECMNILGIDTLSNMDCQQLKAIYRKKVKLLHPDNFSNGSEKKFIDLQEAYERIKKLLTYFPDLFRDTRRIYLSVPNILEIYRGGSVVVNNGKDKVTKADLFRDNIFVYCTVVVVYEGMEYTTEAIFRHSIADEYPLSIAIPADKISDNPVKIKYYNREIETKLLRTRTEITLNLDGYIKLKLLIRLDIIDEDNKQGVRTNEQ